MNRPLAERYDFHQVWHADKKRLLQIAREIGLTGVSRLKRQDLLLRVTGAIWPVPKGAFRSR